MSFSGRLKGAKPPPPVGEGAVAGFQSKKKDNFLWVKGRRGIDDCVFFYSFYAFHFYCNWRLIIIRPSLLPADVDVFAPPPGGIKWQIQAQLFLLFSGVFFMDIYSNFPHCYPVPAPQSTKSTLAPPAPKQTSDLLHSNSFWNNSIALSAGYANVHIFQRIGEMVKNIDI